MKLPEITSSAVAHAFLRFARGAGVGLALGALAACGGGGGGGGSSTPAKTTPTPTPEMTITPPDETPAPTPEDLDSAVDVAGKETADGQLDAPDDADYYTLRLDEDATVTFWVESADLEMQLLDSDGNVLATSSENGGGSSAGLPAPAHAGGGSSPEPAVAPIVAVIILRLAVKAGVRYFVRVVVKKAARQGVKAAARRIAYTLNHRVTRAVLRRTREFLERNLEVGNPEDVELNHYYTSEGDVRRMFSASIVTLNLGPFKLGTVVEGSTLKLSASSTAACRGRAAPKEVKIKLVASARVPAAPGIPSDIAGFVESVASHALIERTLIDNGPRLRSTVTPPISLAVAGGGSATTTLTDFIEDPEGGPLTFAVGSAPAGLRATPAGSRLTVAAGEDAEDGTITVAATDRNNVCRNFPVQVRVGSRVRVKPGYSDGLTGSAVAGNLYVSRDLSEYFDNPLDENLSFTVTHSGGKIYYIIEEKWYWVITQGGSSVELGGAPRVGPTGRRYQRYSANIPSGNDRLVVFAPPSMAPARSISLLVTAKNSAGSAGLGVCAVER